MKAAILQCDDVLEKFQPQFGHYPEMIRRLFTLPDQDFHFSVFDCRKGLLPEDLDAFDFYITTGSKASVYDDQEWIRKLIDFIRLLDRRGKKLIGICFGHQLIAMARQGMVEKSARGWGIGIAANRVLALPEWISEKKEDLNIIVSHQDQVTVLPEDALVIAGSDFCPYFMVQWNDHFLSIQGHPEWTVEYSRTLINDRRAIIPHERIEAGLASLDRQPDNQLFVRWVIDFLQYRT